MNCQISTLEEFWPFYVSQHLNPINRKLHALGTTLALVLGIVALARRAPSVAVLAVAVPYSFAWIGHFFYEHNRPATFTYPLLSLRADFRMYRLTLFNEMDTEILMLTKELKRLRREVKSKLARGEELQEAGQLAAARSLELAVVLAQLRRDVRVAEERV